MKVLDNKIFTEKDIKKLMKVTKEQSTINKAHQSTYELFLLLSITGLRISEALNLDWSDVREDYIVLKKTKSGKPQTVRLGKKGKSLLEEMKKTNNHLLFPSQRGRMSRSGAHRRLKGLLSIAGLSSDYSLHSFRHYSATSYLNNGFTLPEVKELLRHSNVSITSAYLHKKDDYLKRIEEKM